MQVIVQRVQRAAVAVSGQVVGEIELGLVALVGVGRESTERDARWLAAKTCGLRVFNDDRGQMNLSLSEVGGAVLAISQFTLYGDVSRGRRPSFVTAAAPAVAEQLYDVYCTAMTVPVERGIFGAHMIIDFVADGPVTIRLQRAAPGEHEAGRA